MGDKAGTLKRYGDMRDALNATGRSINFALCSWGDNNVWEFGNELGNSWRTTGDIGDTWASVSDLVNRNLPLSAYSHPGGFNDMDMLEVGNGGMTNDEYRSHFSIWAALKSPLLLGNDITRMDQATFEIINNKDVIAVNQDKLGKSAFLRAKLDDVLLWVGELKNGDRVLLVHNGGDEEVTVDVWLTAFTVTEADAIASRKWKVTGVDLWSKEKVEAFKGKMRLKDIPSHGVTRRKGDFPSLENPPQTFNDQPMQYFDDFFDSFWLAVAILAVGGVGYMLVKLEYQRREGYQEI
ncbi:hypothetical protein HDU98_005481, partial [Podochytrium sp. JEL0797]